MKNRIKLIDQWESRWEMLDEKKIKKLSTLSAETYVEPQKMEKFCTILIEEEMKKVEWYETLEGGRLWLFRNFRHCHFFLNFPIQSVAHTRRNVLVSTHINFMIRFINILKRGVETKWVNVDLGKEDEDEGDETEWKSIFRRLKKIICVFSSDSIHTNSDFSSR